MLEHLVSSRSKRALPELDDLQFLETPTDDQYTDALGAGKQANCRAKYSAACPFSLLNFIHL